MEMQSEKLAGILSSKVERRVNGHFERIDLDAYVNMCRVHHVGLCRSVPIADHPLLGTSLSEVRKPHKVIRVSKQWWGGFYLSVLYEDESGSHGVVYRNINSIHPSITGEYK